MTRKRPASPFAGVDIAPHWAIRPSEERQRPCTESGPPTTLLMAPGVGFGLGTHETTQLCMLALGYWLRVAPPPTSVLDFGSGSGILGIAAAVKSGARVEAVEIDDAANQHALENARLNGVDHLIEIRTQLSEPARRYDLVLANVLRPVLVEYAEALCARLRGGDQGPGEAGVAGHMVLSGLVATDVPAILSRYSPLLGTMRPEIYSRGEWRAVVYSAPAGARSA